MDYQLIINSLKLFLHCTAPSAIVELVINCCLCQIRINSTKQKQKQTQTKKQRKRRGGKYHTLQLQDLENKMVCLTLSPLKTKHASPSFHKLFSKFHLHNWHENPL